MKINTLVNEIPDRVLLTYEEDFDPRIEEKIIYELSCRLNSVAKVSLLMGIVSFN